jgi:CBS domain-containing membrane protein
MKVRDIMQREVRTLARNDSLGMADALMGELRIRHIPVLDEDERVCAVLSQRDLFRGALLKALGYGSSAEDRLLNQLRVKEVMSARVYTATPDTTLIDASALMAEHKIGCLPVVEGDNQLVGIVTETDLVRLIAEGRADEI